jgi:hypothetical protein
MKASTMPERLTDYEREQWREAAQDTRNPRQAGLLRTKRYNGQKASGYAHGALGQDRADRPPRVIAPEGLVAQNSRRTSPTAKSPWSSAHAIGPLYDGAGGGNAGHQDDEPR